MAVIWTGVQVLRVNYIHRLQVPCVAVVENMSFFEADGKRYFPFGQGSGKPARWLVLQSSMAQGRWAQSSGFGKKLGICATRLEL